MKFKANTRRRAIEYEKDLVQQWKKNRIFEKSVEMRPIDNSFVFYDGPPFITGVPHHGTLLSSVVKDVVPRYQTMNGKRVERVWGWDCHGLPAENYVEKKLGITDRHDIGTKISLADYIKTARESMVQTSSLWEDTVDRIGRWVDFKGAYKTMDKKYMESVWWAFKTLYEKGKIYEGERVLMYDTKWATPLSKAEVTMDAGAYIDVTDPSVFVKFKLSGENTTLLAWTTTPWTLPANTALAVNDDVEYAEIELETKYRKVFLISGKHAFASISYFPKLKSKLEDLGFDVTIIDHVNYDNPNLADNLSNLERYDFSNSHVITHSLGASTFLKWLDGNNVKVQSLTMFAPGYPGVSHKSKNQDWLTHSGYVGFNVDFDKIKTQIINRPTIIYSNEAQDRFDDFIKLGKKLNAKMVFEPGKEHFFAEDKTSEPNYKISFNDRFILAKETIKQVLTDNKHNKLDFKIIRILSGKDLVGKSYEPLFDDRGENAHKIWAADYVTTESGTGIVHIAPAYGEEDFELARKNKIPVVHVVDDYGKYTETEWIGNDIWEINKTVAKTLLERGIVWKIEYIRHEYPHNPRTGNRLIYRAHPSWFMDIDGQRTEMLEENTEHINWFPEYIKHGRFEKNIQQAPDWNLSRDRFWASAMPVWKGVDSDGKEHIKVVGSYAELKELSGIELEDYHRPWVDDIKFEIDGVKYSRIDKVLDCWFESGSMPFAQFHYPFENVEKFEQNFPGDFIVEYVGQVRAWFYYVHAVSVGIFGHNAFKNVIVTGNIAGNDGYKMSKSRGNFTDPNELMDKYSADSWRLLLLSSPLLNGEDFSLQDKDVSDMARKLSMIWNMYDFFTMYAEVDNWEFTGDLSDPTDSLVNPLDQWIVSRIYQLIQEVTKYMDIYDIPSAVKLILPFIDDASNWYVRRSRRRFWKASDDVDKNNAYRTLHYTLVQLSKVLAPFTPFLAEELYQKLTGGESVHLLDWSIAGHINELVINDMEAVREYVNTGLSIRAKEHQKVRQPLASVTIPEFGKFVDFVDILTEELNVKSVKLGTEFALDLNITPELKSEGMAREIIRYIQNARKEAGLNIDDRIELILVTDDAELKKSIIDNKKVIADETLAVELQYEGQKTFSISAKVDMANLTISLQKNR